MNNKFIWLGISLGAFSWVTESAVHSLVFHGGSILHQIHSPGPHEIWMRIIVVALFATFGIYAQFMFIKLGRTEEEAWQRTFYTVSDLIMIVDNKFRIVKANKAMADMLDTTQEELVGSTCYETLHGLEEPPDFCPHARLLADGLEHTADVFEQRLGRSFLVSVSPYRDNNGTLIGSVHVAHDITERKQAEEAVREEAIRRRILVEQSRDGIVVLDENGKVYEANQRYAEMLGYSMEEVLQLHVWDWDTRWTREQLLEMLRTVDETGDHFETFHRHKDGTYYDVEISTNGTICGGQKLVFCVCRDITERKQAEEMLRESEERFRWLGESAPIGIWHTDSQGRVLYTNNCWQEITGLTLEESLGFDWSNALHPDDKRQILEEWGRCLTEGKGYSGEFRFVSASGEVKWVQTKTAPIHSGKGQIIGYVGLNDDITERKQMEKTLAESQERLAYLIHASPVVIYSSLPGSNYAATFVSKNVKAILGFEPEEFTEDSNFWAEHIHPDDSSHVLAELDSVFEHDHHVHQYRFLHKDGSYRWMYDELRLERNSKGEPVEIIGSWMDITERKQAEEELRKSEEFNKRIIESSHDCIKILDTDGRLQFMSEGGQELLEIDDIGPYLGESWADFWKDSDLVAALEAISKAKKGAIGSFQGFCATALGNPKWWDIVITPIKSADDNVEQLLSISRDITESKESEELLRTEKEKFEVLVEESPLAVALVGKDGTYKYINPKFVEMFGYTLEDVPNGKAWFVKAYPDSQVRDEVISTWIDDSKKSEIGACRPRTYGVTCKDGSEKTIQFRPVAMQNEDQLIIYQDITARKQIEDQLRQAQKMEAIGTLAGGVAHDFNNLLTPIIVHAEIATQSISDQSPIQYNLEKVITAGYRAKDLIEQILAFSRQSERQRIPLNISPILRETLKLLRALLPTTIDVRHDIRASLDVVMADPTEIHQVVLNLCTNAAHAMREKGGVLEVSLVDFEVTPDNSQDCDLEPSPYVRLTVKDTGYGMDQATVDRIFDPFFTSKRPGEGTGMGLAVVHGIVKSYDGKIIVKSEPEKGSTFHILLPIVEQEVLTETEPAGPVPTGTEQILLVDDEKSMIDTMRPMLEHLGYKVVTAMSGVEAIEIFQEEPDKFDLVITDQTMPGMTGKELSKLIISMRPDIPIVLCTGFSEQITEEEAKAIGISQFLIKPVGLRDMARNLRQVISVRADKNKTEECHGQAKN